MAILWAACSYKIKEGDDDTKQMRVVSSSPFAIPKRVLSLALALSLLLPPSFFVHFLTHR